MAMVLSAVMNLAGNFAAQLQRNTQALEQVQKQTVTAATHLQQLEKVTNSSSGGGFFRSLAKESANAGTMISNNLNKIKEKIFNLKTVIGAIIVGTAGKGLFDATIGNSAQFEQYLTSFTVMMGSADKAKAKMQELSDYANNTPFELPGVVTAGRTLMTFGLDTTKYLKDVGNLAAAANEPIEEVARAIGRVGAGDFGEAFERLRDFGISRQMLEAKGLTFDKGGSYTGSVKTALDGVQKIIQEKYNGMTEKQAQTFNGLKSTFADAISAFGRSIGDKAFPQAKAALTSLMTEFDKMGKNGTLNKIGTMVGNAISTIANGIVKATQSIGDIASFVEKHGEAIKVSLASITTAFIIFKTAAMIGGVVDSITRVQKAVVELQGVSKLSGIFTTMFGFSPIILGVVAAVVALAAAAYLVIKNWEPIKKFFSDLWIKVKAEFIKFKTEAIDKINDAVISAKDKFNDFKTKIQELSDKLIKFKDDSIKSTIDKFNEFKQVLKDNQTEIKVTASILGTIFGPALLVTGTKAVIAGTQIAAHFIVSIVKTGTAAVANGIKITASFVASMVKTGAAAVANGIKITASFVASLIKSGVEATISGIKITASFIAAMVKTGAQAVIAGAQITVSFIASLIGLAAQAIITAIAITAQLIVALVSYAAKGWETVAVITIQTASLAAQKIAMLASAVATGVVTAATWLFNAALAANPIVLTIAALALLGLAIYEVVKHWQEICKWIEKAWNWLTTWNGTPAENKSVTFTQTRIDDNRTIGEKAAERAGHNALGTSYWGGGKTYVNEGNRGEIIDLPKGSRVIPHDLSKKSMGNSITIAKLADQIIVREDADIDKIATALAKKLALAEANMI